MNTLFWVLYLNSNSHLGVHFWFCEFSLWTVNWTQECSFQGRELSEASTDYIGSNHWGNWGTGFIWKKLIASLFTLVQPLDSFLIKMLICQCFFSLLWAFLWAKLTVTITTSLFKYSCVEKHLNLSFYFTHWQGHELKYLFNAKPECIISHL